MTSETPTSLTAILKQRQQEEFVGREGERSFFERNLTMQVERRRFVFNVSGQGGIGKTNLSRYFKKLAEDIGALTTWSDESEKDLPSMLGHIANQLDAQGHPLKSFSERYKVYRQRRQELETDPDAPQGLPAFLGRTLARTGIRFARRAPAVGVAFDFVDEETLAVQAGDWMAYLARKVTNKDELQLIKEPANVLTPIFLKDLEKVAENTPIALFFDTYERTSDYLDEWLRGLFEEHYGEVPSNLIMTIAGQHELDKNRWAPYEPITARLPLEAFSVEETHEYLARKGVTDERVIEIITNLSGRLPLLVATLASESPKSLDEVGDPSGTALERFLKWIEDPLRRQIAVDSALPRCLNRDIMAVVVGENEADSHYSWLKGTPFFRTDTWTYHAVVRSQLIRQKHHESPQGWINVHGKLAEYFKNLQDSLQTTDNQQWRDPVAQNYELEFLYHSLCESHHGQLSLIANGFLSAFGIHGPFARRWVETVYQAGTDSEVEELQEWGRRLSTSLKEYEEGRREKLAELLSIFLTGNILRPKQRAAAFALRGQFLGLDEKYKEAIADFTESIKLAPENSFSWGGRGETLCRMERYHDAMSDLDRAILLNPEFAAALSLRGRARLKLDDIKAALDDLDLALKIDPTLVSAVYDRGEAFRAAKRYQDAFREFERAVDMAPESKHFAYRQRGITHSVIGDHQAAAEALIHALTSDPTCTGCWSILIASYKSLYSPDEVVPKLRELSFSDPQNPSLISCRGEALRRNGFLEEALTDLNHAVSFDPTPAEVFYRRSLALFSLKQYEPALTDCERSLELNPHDAVVVTHHGELLQRMESHESALIDFEHAIELKPNLEHKNQKNIGKAQFALRKYREATLGFKRALIAYPECPDCWTWLAKTYEKTSQRSKVPTLIRGTSVANSNSSMIRTCKGIALSNRTYEPEALLELNAAIKADGKNAVALYHRGRMFLKGGRFAEALEDFTHVIQLNAFEGITYAARAQAYRGLWRLIEALADLDKALTLNAKNAAWIVQRGEVQHWLGDYEKSLVDYENAFDLNPALKSIKEVDRILVLISTGKYAEAFAAFEELSSEQQKDRYDVQYNIAICVSRWKSVSEAEYYINLAMSSLNRALNEGHKGQAFYGFGGIEAIRGDSERAIEYLERAVSDDPNYAHWAVHDAAWMDLLEHPRLKALLDETRSKTAL